MEQDQIVSAEDILKDQRAYQRGDVIVVVNEKWPEVQRVARGTQYSAETLIGMYVDYIVSVHAETGGPFSVMPLEGWVHEELGSEPSVEE